MTQLEVIAAFRDLDAFYQKQLRELEPLLDQRNKLTTRITALRSKIEERTSTRPDIAKHCQHTDEHGRPTFAPMEGYPEWRECSLCKLRMPSG